MTDAEKIARRYCELHDIEYVQANRDGFLCREAIRHLAWFTALMEHWEEKRGSCPYCGGIKGHWSGCPSPTTTAPVPSPPTLKRAESAGYRFEVNVKGISPWLFSDEERAREVYEYCTQAYENGRADGSHPSEKAFTALFVRWWFDDDVDDSWFFNEVVRAYPKLRDTVVAELRSADGLEENNR